ncbi:MAG TPA: Ni/Fe hydrogenase subunit alpha [Armatimonadetes bacterium]|jgi:NAD-reducing hydrogenase large subunit|nr:Ni/Fe hydrogenase subunit alpha [Armatimonadota bacterium]
MASTITIEPVTRIEGHAKVTIHLDDAGKVTEARMHVNEFRGFEKFCEGRMFFEMPQITQRICGICPISHHLASAKACDAIVGQALPRPARLIRELMHMGQFIQSHALHLFHLASPDLLLGFDADPATRNVVGVIEAVPDLALKGIGLRKFGQEVIRKIGGKRIHPYDAATPNSVNKGLDPADRDELCAKIDGVVEGMREAVAVVKGYAEVNAEQMESFAAFPSGYAGLVGDQGQLELYEGRIRMVDSQLRPWEPDYDPANYLNYIAEKTVPWSYLKFPYYRKLGFPAGAYRVGPLARLNLCSGISTPSARDEWQSFKALGGGGAVEGSLFYHLARAIEGLHAAERARELLADDDITATETLAIGPVRNREGVGVVEAPRGTLIHHYQVDDTGRLESVNLIVSTGHNNWAMNRAVSEVARAYVDGKKLTEGMLNRVEAAIRCYDPCLSCSTHALGQMPLAVELIDASGKVLGRVARR